MKKFKFKNQKGVSLVEGMTAAAILGVSCNSLYDITILSRERFFKFKKV